MKSKPLILTVRNRRNLELLAQFLDQQGYESFGATSIEKFEQALTKTTEIALVLVDISGFDSHIWKLCELLQNEQIRIACSLASPKHCYPAGKSCLRRSEYANKATGY